MATIQMVNRYEEQRGLNLARRLAEVPTVTAVAWWAGSEDAEPHLLVGFIGFREVGPRVSVEVLSNVLESLGAEAPNYLDVEPVAAEEPRLQALSMHPWYAVDLNSIELGSRFVSTWSRTAGVGQALVYYLKADGEVKVPLPPAPQLV